MKKRLFLKILIALAVLTSILISSLLGVTKAEYFKIISKSVDFEAKPDLYLEYYLVDSSSHTSTDKPATVSKGVYNDAGSFVQPIRVGRYNTTTINSKTYYLGSDIVYQVKIPVDETGYYTLDFNVDFLFGPTQEPNSSTLYSSTYVHPDNTRFDGDFFSVSYQHCLGCEILNADDGIEFGVNTPFRMEFRISDENKRETYSYNDESIYFSDKGAHSVYQWKTMTPTRAEDVKLAFKATEDDVEKGYVIWAWDFEGLGGSHNYRLCVNNLSVNKTMELDGTTKYRTNNDPYFMFPQTSFINDQYWVTGTKMEDGKSSYSGGRGTFVTEATANSLGMRSEVLFFYNGTDYAPLTPSPVSIQVPVKNIKYDTTYKVTFDFSVARQGNRGMLDNKDTNYVNNYLTYNNNMFTQGNAAYGINYHDYADFSDIFFQTTNETMFRSYLHSGLDGIGRTTAEHDEAIKQINYADKTYQNEPLTQYNEVTKFNSKYSGSFTLFPNYTTVESTNDTYSIDTIQGTYDGVTVDSTETRNWFNAVQHVEQNGQHGINWITFYNTTFSFNIGSEENPNIDLNDLYWVWDIEALSYYGWYNVRIDNVRIQEVVQYSSGLDADGIQIGDTKIIANDHSDNYDEETDKDGVFSSLRGRNGTGQNYQARGFVLDDKTADADKRYMAEGNIYAPTVNGRTLAAAPGGGSGANDYKIYLDGWAVCKGGIAKYVWSADGGNTWYDMQFTGTTDTTVLAKAETGIDQRISGTTRISSLGDEYDHVTFTEEDAANNRFDDWSLVADISPYKHQSQIDIIIAAVPAVNQDMRCEIVRIINYNTANYYVSQIEEISSDIQIINGSTTKYLNATLDGASDALEGTLPFSITSATNGTSGTFWADYYPVSNRGVFTHHSNISKRIDYSNLQTTFSDIPVKSTLTVSGGIACMSGVYGYVYSVDGGKTWNDCTQKSMDDLTHDSAQGKISNTYEALLYKWVTRTTTIDSWYFTNANGAFNTDNTKLNIDLSKYEGQVVDVIVAAKPYFLTDHDERVTKTDIFLPVAKIDNVAVYGELGTFYTRVHQVTLDKTPIDNTITENIYSTEFDLEGNALNGSDRWDVGLGNAFGYTIYEPYNVDARQARLYNALNNTISSAGHVKIDGYVFCKGGVKEYKYSLDGGDTWTLIHDTVSDATTTGGALFTSSQKSDSTFVIGDGANGNFCCTGTEPDDALEFDLPALVEGTVKNLLVVAESNYGKLIPVLNINLEISNTNYGYFLNDANGAQSGQYTNPHTVTQRFTTSADSTDTRYKITLPVQNTGIHTLTMDADLDRYTGAVTQSKTGDIYQSWATTKTLVGTGTVSMSVSKTNFIEGEPIYVEYSTKVTGYANSSTNNSGVFNDSVICILRLDDNGDVIKYGSWPRYERVAYVQYEPDGVRNGVTKETSGSVELTTAMTSSQIVSGGNVDGDYKDLPAGNYRIYFINDEDIGLGNVLFATDLDVRYLSLTAPIDITIYESDASIVNQVVHDETDEWTYFSSNAPILENTDVRVEGAWVNNDAFLPKEVTHYINVTKEDVKRGYVVLDWNFTQLDANTDYVLNLTNIQFSNGVACNHKWEDGKCIYCGMNEPFIRQGNYLFFGEYPQSLKADDVQITATTDSRGYFLGSDGNYYAKVVAAPHSTAGDYKFSTGTSVGSGTAYYFKVERIKWRIIEEDTENNVVTVICESIVDARRYDDAINDYASSEVRAWLNSNFYQTAFDSVQRMLIQATEVDNSLATTGYAANNYVCANTTDNIYLPSYADMVNTEYGFSSDFSAFDEARVKSVSDYSIANGAFISISDWENYYGKGNYLTRTPAQSASWFVRECNYRGEITDGGTNVSTTYFGVAPMCRVLLEK